MNYLSYSLEDTLPKLSMLQTNNRSSGVQLPNCYIHATFETVLSVIYRDIRHFINVMFCYDKNNCELCIYLYYAGRKLPKES